ncbi:hypothetical protein [Cronobacter dublinensis]|uniref:hypothetical protein n=1 Tax=Cronobacter dublinensis TaxID=413497 RepID=UPI0013755241|nr:hypothetical protein [Cronobacter dublinensis]NCH58861.1 hypothetical protein [Cronobacter dublinensis]
MKTQDIAFELQKTRSFLDEKEFINTLYSDIEKIIKIIEHSSDKYYCDDEDKLSHTIVSSLIHLGYKATEQTKKNGSVDITVHSRDDSYEWIAEAKIGYGNQKIFEGLLQLLTRYVKRDRNAGLFIYYQKDKSSYYFRDWMKYLHNSKWVAYCTKQGTLEKAEPLLGHLNQKSCPNIETGCCYADVNIVKPSSEDINIRFFYLDIHHDPIDKSGVANQSLARGQAKNKIRELYHLWKQGEYEHSMSDALFEHIRIYHWNELEEEYTDDEDEENDKKVDK